MKKLMTKLGLGVAAVFIAVVGVTFDLEETRGNVSGGAREAGFIKTEGNPLGKIDGNPLDKDMGLDKEQMLSNDHF